MDTTTPVITPETARHVLWLYGAEGGIQPDSFNQRLLAAWDVADPQNFARLELGFPEIAAALAAAAYDPAGIARLQEIARPRCQRCTGDDGPFATRGGDILCEPCAAPQPLIDGGAQ